METSFWGGDDDKMLFGKKFKENILISRFDWVNFEMFFKWQTTLYTQYTLAIYPATK